MSDSKKHNKRVPNFLHSRVISIISISMVLFLMGVVTMLGLIAEGLKDHVREQVNFTVVLLPESDTSEILLMEKELKAKNYVKDLVFFSKEKAMAELTEALGESPEEFLGWNPLSPTFEVYVSSDYMAVRDSINAICKELEAYPLTQSVSFQKDLMDELNANIQTITVITLIIVLLLLVISIVLINNTIRLLIYAKRFTIRTMNLVGATASFIRKPFIQYNVWSGIWAAVVAIALLTWAWLHIIDTYPLLRTVLTPQNGAIVALVVLLLGILISWISAYSAVNKYLRMNINRLYRA